MTFYLQVVAPTNGRVETLGDDVIIYPFGQDWEDYEIVLSNIALNQSIVEADYKVYVLGGEVIGKAKRSPCQPNFIHVSIRKFNSSKEGKVCKSVEI